MQACQNPAMQARWLIIDGYSLLHHDPAFAAAGARGMAAARERLITRLSSAGRTLADRITVVFDGAGFVGQRLPQPPSPVEVLFSTSSETADTIIERLAHSAARAAEILVITSDRAERVTVDAAGAQSMGCTAFLSELASAESTLSRSTAGLQHRGPKPTLGDFFPKP